MGPKGWAGLGRDSWGWRGQVVLAEGTRLERRERGGAFGAQEAVVVGCEGEEVETRAADEFRATFYKVFSDRALEWDGNGGEPEQHVLRRSGRGQAPALKSRLCPDSV